MAVLARNTDVNILVVDDEAVHRLAVGEILRRAGHQVVEAADGLIATEIATAQKFDWVLMDIRMPRLDGIQATEALRQIDPTSRIVVISAFVDGAVRSRLEQLGVHRIISKPIHPEAILEAVSAPKKGKANTRVLYIEDNPENLLLVRRVLERQGYEVLAAQTGLEGLEMAAAEQPDLILLDINLPEFDGYALASRLKQMEGLRETPIVAVTANVMAGDKERSLVAGCDGYIEKPIDVIQFPEQIKAFLSGKRERVESADTERTLLREFSSNVVQQLEAKIRELGQANEELRELDRLKGEFLQNISHELRTPLTPINGYLEMLITGEMGPVTDHQKDAMNAIDRSARKLAELIDRLLDFTRLSSGNTEISVKSFDAAAWLLEICSGAEQQAKEKGIEFAYDARSLTGPVLADRQRLTQLILNLLQNAFKFTPHGRKVTLAAGLLTGPEIAQKYSGVLHGPVTTDLKWLHLSVGDEGIGIAREHHRKIFDRFYQVDGSLTRRFGGMGMGLALVRMITEAHKGQAWVESEPGRGSTFHVIVPQKA